MRTLDNQLLWPMGDSKRLWLSLLEITQEVKNLLWIDDQLENLSDDHFLILHVNEPEQ